MSVAGIESRCWILALFERSDGERFLLGDGAYDFKESQQHFAANDIDNDTVEVQGNDGILLAGQVRRPTTQNFDGYIGDATMTKEQIEQYRRDFFTFFRKNFFYKVIYIFPNGETIMRQRGFLVDSPEVQELWQIHPEYHVALNFEDVNYYSYAEDAEGHVIYSGSAIIPLTGASSGGLVWDEYGVVWDEVGAIWEEGEGIMGDIIVNSTDNVFPIWTVTGEAVKPQLENTTTGTLIKYNGTVSASQTLVIDMLNQTATLNGVNVIGNVSGDWVMFAPNRNRVVYNASNAAPASKVEWNDVVG